MTHHDVYKCRVCCNRMWQDMSGLIGHELAKLYASRDPAWKMFYEATPLYWQVTTIAERIARVRNVRLFNEPSSLVERGAVFAEVLYESNGFGDRMVTP